MPQQQEILSTLPLRRLEEEFRRRRSSNSRYSLRAYAKTLGLSPGRLSEILAGKRSITPATAEKICLRLALSPKEAKAIQESTVKKQRKPSSEESYLLLEEDQFTLLAENYYTNFLALIDTDDFNSDSAWISRRLGISPIDTRTMLARLQRLGLIELRKQKWEKTQNQLRTSDGISSAALRKSHTESLRQAIGCLEEIPIEERDITSITMAIDPRKIPLAKKLIRDFRFQLAELLEAGDRTEVYNLNLQLVPVSKKEKK